MGDRDWIERKCVRIWRESGDVREYRGSGFLITHRHILTAAHVVKGTERQKLVVTGRPWGGDRTVRDGPHYHQASSVRQGDRDVAVLELADSAAAREAPIGLPRAGERPRGERLLAGFADANGDAKVLSYGVQSYHDGTDSLVLDVPVEPGMSGGPAVVGELIEGVVFATNEEKHKTYIVPLSAFRPFLAGFLAAALGPAPAATSRGVPFADLMKWIWFLDRKDQVPEFADILGAPSGSAPVLATIHCGSSDRHGYLMFRLKSGEAEFDLDSPFARQLPGIPIHQVEFPLATTGVETELRRLKERLRQQLLARSASPGDVVAALNASPTASMVFATFACTDGLVDCARRDLLHRWIGYWGEVAAAAGGVGLMRPLLVLICLVSDAETPQGPSLLTRWFGRSRRRIPIHQILSDAGDSGISICQFTPLGMVGHQDVYDWVEKLCRMYATSTTAKAEILTSVSDVIPMEGIRMSDFTDRARLKQLRLIEERE